MKNPPLENQQKKPQLKIAKEQTLKRSIIQFLHSATSNKKLMVGSFILVVFLLMAAFPQFITPYDPWGGWSPTEIFQPPSWKHLFGTDDVGKDLFAQVVWGTRTTIYVGLAGALISLLIGVSIGLTTGYFGGLLSDILMRFVDIMLVIPLIVLAIILAAILEPSLQNIIIVIGVTGWKDTARLVRSQVVSIKERLFIEKAKSIGCSHYRILSKHIIPHIIPLILVTAIMTIARSILAEAFLAFIGLGDASVLSWGRILQFGFTSGSASFIWWYIFPPGLCIMLVILAFTMISTGVNDILQIKIKRVEI